VTSLAVRMLRAGSSVAGVAPMPLAQRVAGAGAVLAGRVPPSLRPLAALSSRRALVERNLRRVVGPGPGPREMARMVDAMFASYARYWAESLALPHLSRDEIVRAIRYEGFGHIDDALAAGTGVILALPHLGGWEWAGADLGARGYPISVVVERLQPPDVFEWFVDYREDLGMRVIPMGPEAAARCSRALADNRVLCLLSDRVVGDSSSVGVQFFGEATSLPVGPAMLALRSGAPLLPVGVYFGRRAPDHLALVLPPLARPGKGRLRDDVAAMTQSLAGAFEGLIRRDPTQWHLLQPNWPGDESRPG